MAIALLADISIAARKAKLIEGHLRVGLVPGDHAVLIWPLLCGLAKTKYLIMTNRPMTGEEAERIKLISLAVDADDVQTEAVAIATTLAAVAPTALSMTMYVMNHWLQQQHAYLRFIRRPGDHQYSGSGRANSATGIYGAKTGGLPA